MKNSQVIGIVMVIIVIATCFFPWVFIESKQIPVTGLNAAGTNFGKPGKMVIYLATLSAVLFLINKIWAKRINVFITAFCFAWTIRNYLILSACFAGECPEKKWALYVLVASSALMMLMSFLPKIRIENN